MPFTVITLKKVPNSIRGDLTRWMQEIATGVYVGNFNSRVREYLWKRVTDSVGNGEATMSYACRNEIGYSFCTWNTERQVVDYDGIPLVLLPPDPASEKSTGAVPGFSNAAKYHRALRKVNPAVSSEEQTGEAKKDSVSVQGPPPNRKISRNIIFIDIETTGLDAESDQIIEIGAVRVSGSGETEFHRLICTDRPIPDVVRNLTGITEEMLKDGSELESSIRDLEFFIRDAILIGYNIAFDIKFLNKAFEQYSLGPIHNRTVTVQNP